MTIETSTCSLFKTLNKDFEKNFIFLGLFIMEIVPISLGKKVYTLYLFSICTILVSKSYFSIKHACMNHDINNNK